MTRMLMIATLLSASLFGAADMNATAQQQAKADAKAKIEAQAKADAMTLERAYAKEFAFLKAQKESLKKQLTEQKIRYDAQLSAARKDVDTLEDTLLGFEVKIDAATQRLVKAQQAEQGNIDNSALIDGTITQSKASLDSYGIRFSFDQNSTDVSKMEAIFKRSLTLINDLASVTHEAGSFYLPDGSKVDGEIIKIGNIAAYGSSPTATGALAPAGNNAYKLWNMPESAETARMIAQHQTPSPLHIFVYENLKKEVEYAKEKSVIEIIDDGGIIGWVIVGLGAFGVLLTLLRTILLMRAGNNTQALSSHVVAAIESGKSAEEAAVVLQNHSNSVARVLKATMRNLDRDRAHLEDIISENILNESSKLDRFGSMVLVFAAVAPLLGLLGTVTGMIATFDIITEFGTGDPKLLAGGISIALVTTELGLIVAIPLLLVGNLLSGWANSIKDNLEHSALRIVNIYNKRR
jgi:biopolymer transport protein ExbB